MSVAVGEDDLDPDPIRQFSAWYQECVDAGEPEPHAMALATAGTAAPSVRFVLLKGFDRQGFVFYTNWHSRKAREIEANPNVALAFRWRLLERQVRVVGTATKVSGEESDAYFATRPRPAQLGAWASEQSQPVASRAELDERLAVVTRRFAGREVPRPPWWGGFRVRPAEMEFWISRPDRLHDRFQYLNGDTGWTLRRLYP